MFHRLVAAYTFLGKGCHTLIWIAVNAVAGVAVYRFTFYETLTCGKQLGLLSVHIRVRYGLGVLIQECVQIVPSFKSKC